jgi:hypothetical protein
MSHATDTLEAAIGNALFLGQPFPAVTQWTVHLLTSSPNDAGVGGTEVQAGANGYQPVRHDPGPERWLKAPSQDAQNNTVFRNALPVQFPTALANWGTITGFGLKNQNSELLYVAPLTANKAVNTGEAPIFLAGELQFLIG